MIKNTKMDVKFQKIKIRDLVSEYEDNQEQGVFAYGRKLDVRPPYQREFVYNEKQRNSVIKTIEKNFPLNIMYWSVKDDGNFEIIDGQQRTISICEYVEGNFSVKFQGSDEPKTFYNLPKDKQEKILNYELMIYFCKGNESEKLEWFKTINIAGEKLKEQELRNAVYSGSWVSDAKKYFSKVGGPAYSIGEKYLNKKANRQEYLETAIGWIYGGKDNESIKNYMSKNQHKKNASELWQYFQAVINWIKVIFPTWRKEMRAVEWGFLYNEFKDINLNSHDLEGEVEKLMLDEDVENKKGIYQYVLTRKEKFLNIRIFSDNQKRKKYEEQKGICVLCKEKFDFEKMEADHITPWVEGGKTNLENCQMLCRECNRRKSKK